jgi:hypothetical protein
VNNAPRSSTNNNPQTVWILWGAFLVSLTIYAGLGVALGGAGPIDAAMLLVMYGCALTTAVAWALIPMIMKNVPAMQRFLIRCAIAEAIGVFSFMLAFLGASLVGWVPLFAVSVLLMLASNPRGVVAA